MMSKWTFSGVSFCSNPGIRRSNCLGNKMLLGDRLLMFSHLCFEMLILIVCITRKYTLPTENPTLDMITCTRPRWCELDNQQEENG